jgi:UDP-N-acetylglucosamine 1-carboxyvinyltransferase
MVQYTIHPSPPLHGSVRLGGAKNVSYKLMIAALLGEQESRILNFSHISDVDLVRDAINSLGARAYNAGERTMFVDPAGLNSPELADQYGKGSRASTLFLPALLHKFGRAIVPLPGGDRIGKRPLDRHMESLQALGVTFIQHDNALEARAENGLHGATYRFAKSTHTGTETMIMAAAVAQGKTVIENAAEEPEIDDMIAFLNKMGARINRRPNRVIEIEGVAKLHSAVHRIMPDQNEAVSYAVAAVLTQGDIIVENARAQHMEAFLEALDRLGGGYEVGDYGIRFFYKGALKATDVTTAVHPGFKTDWQPLWAVLLTQAVGTSTVHETVTASRFQYVEALQEMGAQIELFSPEVSNPDEVYSFNTDEIGKSAHAMRITGPTPLTSLTYTVPDLRAGATILLAGLIGNAPSTLIDTERHVERGYEAITQRLRSMGAKIDRQES